MSDFVNINISKISGTAFPEEGKTLTPAASGIGQPDKVPSGSPEMALPKAQPRGHEGTGEDKAKPRQRRSKTEDLPHTPVKIAHISAERLAMLATARRNRIGDSTWAAVSGFAASLPASVHDLIDAYSGTNPPGLSAGRLVDVAICVLFLGFFFMSLFRERGQCAADLLEEILDPEAPKKRAAEHKEQKRLAFEALQKALAEALRFP